MRARLAGVTKSHGAQVVLEDASLEVGPRARIGLVGPNGVGKSTVLRLLAGEEAPDRGVVALDPPTLTVAHLPQEAEALPGETLHERLARRTGVAAAERELQAAAAALSTVDDARARFDTSVVRPLRPGALAASWRSGERTSTRARHRSARSSGSEPRSTGSSRRCRAARRRGRRSPRCFSPRRTSCCSTSRRTTWTPTGLARLTAVRRLLPGRDRAGLPRPGIPRRDRPSHRRDRPARASDRRVERRLVGLRATPRRGPARRLRTVRRRPGAAPRAHDPVVDEAHGGARSGRRAR